MNSQSARPGGEAVHYLGVDDLYNINFTVTGGQTYVRDIHLLQSAAKRPAVVVFGQEQFPTLVDKAGALLHSLSMHHLFVDGNKRTAMLATQIFLERNGCAVAWDEDDVQAYLLEAVQARYSVVAVTDWLAEFVVCG